MMKSRQAYPCQCPRFKFADDSEITGQTENDDDSVYIEEIYSFVKWCHDNYLYLNFSRTKEMCVDFRKCRNDLKPVCIKK